ncbi:MAG: DNA-processing protein DprA [Litoreibacter sp.]
MTSNTLSTPPPLAPPKTSGCWTSWLRLIRSYRVGTSTFYRLLNEHGSAQAALEALPDIANKAGVAKYTPFPVSAAERELARGQTLGATLIAIGTPQYPKHLAEISDAPPLLWTLGDTALMARPCIGIVGARNASSLGGRMARNLANELTEAGFAIVSGLARGIDAAAHVAALKNGTIAIQAGGIDQIYPAENAKLHDDIARHGLRVTEQAVGLIPKARDFPKRNRIISGMSQAVLVVEAAAKSGSLITARNALDQGRDVLVVPGHPMDGRSSGCNMLIRDGATLIRNAQDVVDAITPPDQYRTQTEIPLPDMPPQPTRPVHSAMEAHAKILGFLGPTPVAEDQLIRDSGFAAKSIAPHITSLEMEGKIKRHPGGMLARII